MWALSLSLMFCSGGRLILVVVWVVLLFSSASQYEWEKGLPLGDDGGNAVSCPYLWRAFSNSVKFISNHTNVGINFVKVYGSVWFVYHGDNLFQDFYMCALPVWFRKSELSVSVLEKENRHYPWLHGYTLPLVQKQCQSILPCLWYCLSQLPQG